MFQSARMELWHLPIFFLECSKSYVIADLDEITPHLVGRIKILASRDKIHLLFITFWSQVHGTKNDTN